MTLRELIMTNEAICKVDIKVRDYRDGHAQLIQEYHIGPYEENDRFADSVYGGIEPRWIAIKKPINYKDIGKDYWGVFLKNIPKQLLDMQVHHWYLWTGWTTNNGLNKHYWLNVDVVGKDDMIEAIVVENKPIVENEQLPGQINLLDII